MVPIHTTFSNTLSIFKALERFDLIVYICLLDLPPVLCHYNEHKFSLGTCCLFPLAVHSVVLPFLLQEGDSALHDAVRLNRYKIIKMLILHGADMMAKNRVSLAHVGATPGRFSFYSWVRGTVSLPSAASQEIHSLMCRL